MPKTTPFKALTADLDARPDAAERRAAAEADLADELASYVENLAGIRKARAVNQIELAAAIGVGQSWVSNVENQDDMLLSTIRRYVAGLGGELHLVAAFPNSEDVTIIVSDPPAASG